MRGSAGFSLNRPSCPLPSHRRGRMLASRNKTAGRTAMADAPVVAVSRLLDERGLSSFHIKLLIWSLFIVLIDGYDIGAIAFAAPSLVRAWGIDRKRSGPCSAQVSSVSSFGSAIFRLGRRSLRAKSGLVGSLLVVRYLHLDRRLQQHDHPDVLAAPHRRNWNRRRHPECHRDQRRIGAAPVASDAGARRRRVLCRSAVPFQAS